MQLRHSGLSSSCQAEQVFPQTEQWDRINSLAGLTIGNGGRDILGAGLRHRRMNLNARWICEFIFQTFWRELVELGLRTIAF